MHTVRLTDVVTTITSLVSDERVGIESSCDLEFCWIDISICSLFSIITLNSSYSLRDRTSVFLIDECGLWRMLVAVWLTSDNIFVCFINSISWSLLPKP
jgi:hypothetical protein